MTTDDYLTETVTLYNAMDVKPSVYRLYRINETIKSLKTSGLWNKLGFLYIYMAHDSQASLIDWINPSSVATIVSTPAFTTNVGWSGNGSDAYLNDNVTWSNTLKLSYLNGHAGALFKSTSSTNAGRASAAISGIGNGLIIVDSENNSRFCSKTISATVLSDSNIHFRVSRRNSDTLATVWTDGAQDGSLEVSGDNPVNSSRLALRSSGAYAPATMTVMARTGGSYLNDSDCTTLMNILNVYQSKL